LGNRFFVGIGAKFLGQTVIADRNLVNGTVWENTMKRIILGPMAAIFFIVAVSAMAGAQAQAPSLGDYARSVRRNKPQATKAPAKVYDNDTLPINPTISVVGAKPGTSTDTKAENTSSTSNPGEPTNDKKTPAEIKPGQSLEDRKKLFESWRTQIDEQKRKVDQLAHEVDDYQRNSTLAQVSVWPETQKYNQGLADKQKALAQAKAELNDLQEQARKSGVPASVAE
jgi:hypothetical protein